jgi:small conductance mechanosensitive channel
MKVPTEAISAFESLIAFTVIVMTIMVIMKKKSLISLAIRGNLSAASGSLSFVDNLRLWVARTWHVLAISYLIVGYIVTMMGAEGGFWIMQQGTVGTLLAIVSMRFLLYFASRFIYKKRRPPMSGGIYRPVLRVLFKLTIWVVGLASILLSWGIDAGAMFMSSWGQRISGSVFSIVTALLVLVAIYEAVHFIIEARLYKTDDEGKVIEADARLRTLLPMLHNVTIFILALIAVMVLLSELGIDTGPLLAGAGVLGVALGFGSQTLVKDFLTGMFILIEDTMAVGDVIQLGNHKGTVESMTLRTVKLRDKHGALHVIPFSSIADIINMSKDYAYALLDMDVDYGSDLNKVQEVILRVGNELGEDPEYKSQILEPISILGVQAFASSAITIRSRIKTVGGKQWDVRRAFFARIKPAFDEAGIEIPFPHVVHVNR